MLFFFLWGSCAFIKCQTYRFLSAVNRLSSDSHREKGEVVKTAAVANILLPTHAMEIGSYKLIPKPMRCEALSPMNEWKKRLRRMVRKRVYCCTGCYTVPAINSRIFSRFFSWCHHDRAQTTRLYCRCGSCFEINLNFSTPWYGP